MLGCRRDTQFLPQNILLFNRLFLWTKHPNCNDFCWECKKASVRWVHGCFYLSPLSSERPASCEWKAGKGIFRRHGPLCVSSFPAHSQLASPAAVWGSAFLIAFKVYLPPVKWNIWVLRAKMQRSSSLHSLDSNWPLQNLGYNQNRVFRLCATYSPSAKKWSGTVSDSQCSPTYQCRETCANRMWNITTDYSCPLHKYYIFKSSVHREQFIQVLR